MAKLTQLILLLALVTYGQCTINFVKDLLQFNVFGIPVLHKKQEWSFDPEEGIRRSRQYQQLNGKFGEKAIERLGLGIDGFDQERLVQQRQRDAQLLGQNYINVDPY